MATPESSAATSVLRARLILREIQQPIQNRPTDMKYHLLRNTPMTSSSWHPRSPISGWWIPDAALFAPLTPAPANCDGLGSRYHGHRTRSHAPAVAMR